MPLFRFMVMELAEAGFGTPGELVRERVDLFCDAYDFVKFKNKFEYQSHLMGKLHERNESR